MRTGNISLRTPDEFSKARMQGTNMKFVEQIFGVIKEIGEEEGI
jgi:hypothetical protein